ncbi:cache domain-containing protein [Tropicimonas sp. S265A]|uniref:cache domain-containing protein n=1 Tax=Tropicimonas sp. S265A TaxID=3415134 RepID=UPI003C7ECF60
MNTLLRRWGGVRSLRNRLVILLSIGILPLGVVAVVQTAAVVKDARVLEERDVLNRTLEAASNEQSVLRKSFGAASALGANARVTGPDSETCQQIMEDFVAQTSPYIFAGFISADGIMRCTSTGDTIDLSAMESWTDFVADPRPVTAVNAEGAATGQSVIITTVPVFDPVSNDLIGAASISLPHRVLDQLFESSERQLGLALLDPDGTVLMASTGIDRANQFERLGLDPAALDVPSSGLTFLYDDQLGNERLAALVPLLEDRVFVLGLWEKSVRPYSIPFLGTPEPLFPILMWVVALGLAILAVDRLILRHLKEIDDKMSGFSLDDPRDSYASVEEAPSELRSIGVTYNRMVERILHDAALLEDAVREKELLLREITTA